MAAYAEVDPTIDAWAASTVKALSKVWAGKPARFAYLPGLRPSECFQISIEPPAGGRVIAMARSVDTDDERDFEQRWGGPIETLGTMLDEATNWVQNWASRPTADGHLP